MKVQNIFLFLFLFVLNPAANGQYNTLQSKLINEQYSWDNHTTQEVLDSYYLNLNPIQASKHKSHFRISTDGQILDFFSDDDVHFSGFLINYTVQYKKVKKSRKKYEYIKYQYVLNKNELESSKITSFLGKLYQSGQLDIPKDSIKKGFLFTDCGSLTYSYNVNGQFNVQSLECPWGWGSNEKYQNTVMGNYNYLDSIFGLKALYDSFEIMLPKGQSYSNDGFVMMNKLTDKQLAFFKKDKPRRDYMDSIKVTLDSCLKIELDTLSAGIVNFRCSGQYLMTFGKNGKLKRLKIYSADKPKIGNYIGLRWYLSDRRDYRKCRRQLKKLLKTIDLGFLNLNYEVTKIVSFGQDNHLKLDRNF